MPDTVNVIKRNAAGQEVWRYAGTLLEQRDDAVVLEAFFDREDMLLHGMPLRRGDRFVETYYREHWYNVFEIYDHRDGVLVGWYCNITSPAEIVPGQIAYNDLALDLLVFPDGRQVVLDEDEFSALDLDEATRNQACRSLAELQAWFKARQK